MSYLVPANRHAVRALGSCGQQHSRVQARGLAGLSGDGPLEWVSNFVGSVGKSASDLIGAASGSTAAGQMQAQAADLAKAQYAAQAQIAAYQAQAATAAANAQAESGVAIAKAVGWVAAAGVVGYVAFKVLR